MMKKVMVVDDELDVLDSLRTILEHQNYEVITVSNGVECFKEIKKGFKGIILMDLMMPIMDGWDTINEIVKEGYLDTVTISIITGKGTKDYQKLSLLGDYIFDYLAKPIDVNQLTASIERAYNYFNSKNI